jgi:large subunit ribosomal protein L4
MASTKVFNLQATEVETIKLNDKVFGVPYNEPLIHQVVVAYLANQRQGTKSTLSRSEVRGRAKKPWKQKHTGHARQGSRRGPQWIKGGMAFALKPRDFSQKVNKTMRRSAFRSAISTKLADKNLVVVENMALDTYKTKKMVEIINNFKFEKSVLIVLDAKNENVMKASANLANVKVVNYDLLNTYQIVSADKVMITKEAIKSIEEAYTE